MSAKYDTESLLDSVLQIMTNAGALNTKIAAIDAEKTAAGKSLTSTLAPIGADSYYLQTWTDKVLQTSPAIFYGVEDVKAESAGAVVAKGYTLFVEIVLVDSMLAGVGDGAKRIMRYTRALEELFAENFAPAIAGGRVKVDQVRPIGFKLALDSDDEVKVGGVSLMVTLV